MIRTRKLWPGCPIKGPKKADSLDSLINKLQLPRVIWMMVPAGAAVDQTLEALEPHLKPGDLTVDGGNSYYRDTLRRAARMKEKSILFVDVGTSGGIWGLLFGGHQIKEEAR